jgi:FAD/FMN-containing dehydrogenase
VKKRIRQVVARLVVLGLLLAGVLLVRPVIHIVRFLERDSAALQGPPPGYTDDASRLNTTRVAEIWEIPVSHHDPEGQLAALLARAARENLRVSVAGARHSMGGHTIYPDGIVVNMLPWKSLALDAERELLTVGAGALWKDVVPYLDEHQRSVAVMQSNHSFSVGGSLSVNCHGWQYGRPPIASSVESFRLMLADGSIVTCSRSQSPELFSLALGGYGLFGIILDVQLRVVPNQRYRLEQFVVPTAQALATLENNIKNQSDVQMVYARMNVTPQRLFDEVIISAFHAESGGEIPPLTAAGLADLLRAVFRGSAYSDYCKELRWNAETKVQRMLSSRYFSRNQLLNEGVEVFQNRSTESTDILHEYFVPWHRVTGFVTEMKTILGRRHPSLLNVTVRHVEEDHDTFLRYADQPMACFVLLFVQPMTHAAEQEMRDLTRELIDSALKHEGRYYLTYRLHATAEQFHQAYPQARAFFELKRKYDPQELFQNQFYLRYGSDRPAPDEDDASRRPDRAGSD